MLYRIVRVVFITMLLNLSVVSQSGQTTKMNLDFVGYPVGSNAEELFLNKNLLFSSFDGKPQVAFDSLVSKKMGICSDSVRSFDVGYLTTTSHVCADLYVGFVKSDEKMVQKYAKNIVINVVSVGAVKGHWIGQSGTVESQVSTLQSDGTSKLSIPGKTEGVLITSENLDCALCNFMVTKLAYEIINSNDPICGESDTDAAVGHKALIKENYSEEVYKKLDSFAIKNKTELPVKIQNLTPKTITGSPKTTFIDEFAIIVKMPDYEGKLLQEIFKSMRIGLDTVGIGEPAKTFKSIGSFSYFQPELIKKNPGGLPGVTDIFQVDIYGPDNGDVMMTELDVFSPTASRFRYTTLDNNANVAGIKGNLNHPNNGSREYGFAPTLDGRTKFFVRGIDQFFDENFLSSSFGLSKQEQFWLSFLEGIGKRVEAGGGKIIYPAKKTVDVKVKEIPSCYEPPNAKYRANPATTAVKK